jgi:hypothetical protein
VCSCLESDDLLTHRVSMMMVDRKFSREQSCQQGLRLSEHHGMPRSTRCLKSTSPYVAAFAIIVIVRPLVAHAAITNRIGRCSIYKRNCRKSRGTFGRSLSEHCPISRSMTSDATAVSPTDDFGKPHNRLTAVPKSRFQYSRGPAAMCSNTSPMMNGSDHSEEARCAIELCRRAP